MTNKVSYKPFARKYRPQNLNDLIGQDSLVKIINNGILQNKIAHSYILTGIRGIGKTTTARIIARLLNCTNRSKNDEYVEACGNCVNCQNFKSHPDIIEIDAASNTSVEDAKIIIEQAEYRPILGKYKVFIIDEVHMLSKSAFNALLKCIEEPNENTVFIFATTEINKVPLTIISRCQRFDLKRFKITDLIVLINKVCDSENISREESAIKIIAQKSSGSARDCLSILEQVALYSSNKITKSSLEDVLGLISTDDIILLVDYILKKDLESVIELINKMWDINADFVSLAEEIINLLSNVAKFKLTKSNLDVAYEDYAEKISELATIFDMHYLTIVWQLFSKSLHELKHGHDPKMHMEMIFVKAMYASTLPSLEEAIKSANTSNKNVQLHNQELRINKHIGNKQEDNSINHNSTTSRSKSNTLEAFERIPINSNAPKAYVSQDMKLDEYLVSILEFLHKKYEFDLYYYLISESEVIKIDNNSIHICGNEMSSDIKEKLVKSLKNLNNQTWSVKFTKVDKFLSLKNRMQNDFEKSEMMKIIKERFPQSKLVDIIFGSY